MILSVIVVILVMRLMFRPHYYWHRPMWGPMYRHRPPMDMHHGPMGGPHGGFGPGPRGGRF